MRHSYHYILLIVTLLLFGASCSTDSIRSEDDCLQEGYRDSFKISLSVDDSLHMYKEVVSDYEGTRCPENAGMRYTICIYTPDAISRNDYPVPLYRFTSSNPDFNITLRPGKYKVFAWADYEPLLKSDNHYFHVDDFSDMMLVDKFGYSGSDDLKMGFLGSKDITVSYRTPDYEIELENVMGQYRLMTSDEPQYDVDKVVISYPSGVPASLNALKDTICYQWEGIKFEAYPSDYLTFDNILAENEEHELELKIEVYDKNGNLRARRKSVMLPIIRGGITDAKIQLYSVLEDDERRDTEGGCGINEKYDDTIFIRI